MFATKLFKVEGWIAAYWADVNGREQYLGKPFKMSLGQRLVFYTQIEVNLNRLPKSLVSRMPPGDFPTNVDWQRTELVTWALPDTYIE
ncbi:hypothetical protein [Mariniblastus fucicola]|uniref:Uncharacterized protein n=1 Tax=Mariniblastus fucicola TaxID=980251 RepID=A0A5B9P674_9BACT|nr:hypothetical protein [Mariniblastus fucicola]QEG22087.1 hypothetical protein MFFC18_19480 [Mariniblastus fucicola]